MMNFKRKNSCICAAPGYCFRREQRTCNLPPVLVNWRRRCSHHAQRRDGENRRKFFTCYSLPSNRTPKIAVERKENPRTRTRSVRQSRGHRVTTARRDSRPDKSLPTLHNQFPCPVGLQHGTASALSRAMTGALGSSLSGTNRIPQKMRDMAWGA